MDGVRALSDKNLEHVSTEMSLHVLTYNLQRVMKIMGVPEILKAIRLAVA